MIARIFQKSVRANARRYVLPLEIISRFNTKYVIVMVFNGWRTNLLKSTLFELSAIMLFVKELNDSGYLFTISWMFLLIFAPPTSLLSVDVNNLRNKQKCGRSQKYPGACSQPPRVLNATFTIQFCVANLTLVTCHFPFHVKP